MRRDFLNGQLPAFLMTRQPSVSLGTLNPRFGLLKISRCQKKTSTRCFALQPSPPLCGLHRCPAMRRWQPLDARPKDSSAFQPATQQDRLLRQASLLSSLAPGCPQDPIYIYIYINIFEHGERGDRCST